MTRSSTFDSVTFNGCDGMCFIFFGKFNCLTMVKGDKGDKIMLSNQVGLNVLKSLSCSSDIDHRQISLTKENSTN